MPTYPIQIKRSGTAASAPSSLAHGELALNYADKVLYFKDASNVIQSFTFQSYALASHTHAASDITSGTLDAARLPLATTLAAGAVIVGTGLGVSSGTVSVTYGTTSGTACQGNDSRLSDARTPTSHAHGNISNAGAIGATANLPVITTTSGVLTTGTFGTSASSFCEGNDARLSDTRTPTDNTVSTAKIQNDAVTYAKIQNVSATDRLLGRSSAGAGDVEEITCTSFGRSLISSADAPAARTTLSVQPTASPAFTGAATFANTGDVVPLTVTNAGTANSFVVNDASGDTTPFVIDAAGNVGIGVSSPTHKLDCGGEFRLRGTGPSSEAGKLHLYYVSDTNRATITTGPSGEIIVETGASSPATRLTISSTGTATFTGQILADDLTTSNSVVYGFDGDTNTGVGRGGADILTFVTNGSERVRVDASGNVGIGTTSAAGRLHAYNGADATTAVLIGEVSGAFSNAADMSLRRGGTELGRVSADYFDGMNFLVTSGSGNAAVQRMRINTGGELMIGYTTDQGGYLLQVNSQIYATNATIATSDARFKTNVEALTDATSVIESLRPVAFDFIPQADRNFATERQVGLIAQEAQAALAGTDYADSVVAQCGDHLGLAYEKLVPVLIKALQESNARIAALEERING
jgi:hypothetical protein